MKLFQKTWKSILEHLQTNSVYGVTLDNILLKLIFISILVTSIIWMLPAERPFEYSNLTVGTIAPEEIIAPFKFAIQKTNAELKQERAAAQNNVPPVFDRNPDIKNRQMLTLNRFFGDLSTFFKHHARVFKPKSDLHKKSSIPEKPDSLLRKTAVSVDSFLTQLNIKYNIRLDTSELGKIYTIYENGKLDSWAKEIAKGLEAVYEMGILDRNKESIVENAIVISENGIEEAKALNAVLELPQAKIMIDTAIRVRFSQESNLQQLTDMLLPAFLVPNLVYNSALTTERKEKAVHDVPLTRGYVEQDERIIDSNEKITNDIYQKLTSLSIALKERSATQRGWQQFKFHFGRILFALTVIMLAVFYLYYYRRSIFRDNLMLGMITIIFLFQFIGAGLITNLTSWPALTIPVILAPMLLAMLLDFGFAFICVVSISLILGAMLGYDYTFTFITLIVGSVAIFSVQKIRNRKQMFQAILFIMLAYLVAHSIFGLMHFKPAKDIFTEFLYFMIPNAILAPIVVYFLIGVFERFFDVTTDITLLELSDLNHPLLKQLSVKAPGTFHHSIVVANLAEAAAEAIRANALLARVGAYFHDIGKMDMPEYFVENQHGGINKHDNISPRMSYLILVNHVKEGVKLAEKYRLPKAVKQFIREHHGTTLVSFFYRKAVDCAKDGEEIQKTDFRYPGPKPQTKETAIAMLSDTVEAASRVLKSPTPQRIRNLIDDLVDNKIEEGQLDECDLTLNEIREIKEAFIPILTGIHHLRIEYPEAEPEKKVTRDKNGPLSESKDKKERHENAPEALSGRAKNSVIKPEKDGAANQETKQGQNGDKDKYHQ